MKNSNIVLIGYMGCGKTTVGRLLSESLGMDFADTDELIERQMDFSVSDIFKGYGEEYFRDLETNLIKGLAGNLSNTVLSTGGGLVVRKENHIYLKKTGRVIYLKVSEFSVVRRLKGDTTRPLLSGSDEEVRKKVHDMLINRDPLYALAADITVDTDALSPEDVAHEIIKRCDDL